MIEGNAKKLKLNRDRANLKTQSDEYRRFKLLDARKRSVNSINNANSTHSHFTNGTNDKTVDINGSEQDVSNTDVKKSLTPAMEDNRQTNGSLGTKDTTNNSETNFEEIEQDQQEQGGCNDMEENKYVSNRSQMRMMDSSSKRPFRLQTQQYQEQTGNSYNGNSKSSRNSNIGN